jgi:hypothetical protein
MPADWRLDAYLPHRQRSCSSARHSSRALNARRGSRRCRPRPRDLALSIYGSRRRSPREPQRGASLGHARDLSFVPFRSRRSVCAESVARAPTRPVHAGRELAKAGGSLPRRARCSAGPPPSGCCLPEAGERQPKRFEREVRRRPPQANRTVSSMTSDGPRRSLLRHGTSTGSTSRIWSGGADRSSGRVVRILRQACALWGARDRSDPPRHQARQHLPV